MPQDQNQHPEMTDPTAAQAQAETTPERETARESQAPRPGMWTWVAFALMLAAMAVAAGIELGRLPWVGIPVALMNLRDIFGQPWQFPTHAALGLAVSGAMVAGLFGVGYGMIAAIRPWRRMLPLAWERAALALPVAAVPVSLAVLGLGLAGLTGRGVYGVLLGVMLAGGGYGWVRFWKECGMRNAELGGGKPWLLLGLAVVMLGLSLVYSLSPSIQSDELRYHLAAPATWLRDGRIHYLHYQAFSNFPMLGEMLFMMAMGLGGEEAAKPLHLAFVPVCLALLALVTVRLMQGGGFGRRRPGIVLAAGALFVFIPTVPILAGWAFIEIFVVAYFLMFAYLAGRALTAPGRASGTLIGLACAGGISVKYTLLALLGGLGALWLAGLMLAGAGWRRTARLGAVVALTTIVLGGGWFARNYAWTHNPLYPLPNRIFGEGEWTRDNQQRFENKAHEKGMHLKWVAGKAGQLVEFVISPVTTTFFDEKFEFHALGPLPLLGVLTALGWLAGGRGWGKRWGRRKNQGFHGLNGFDGFDGLNGVNRDRATQEDRGMASITSTSTSTSTSTNENNFVGGKFGGKRGFTWWVVVVTLVSWVIWFKTYQSNRFLLPTAGLTLALGMAAVAGWEEIIPGRFLRRAPRWILLAGAVYAFLFTSIQLLVIFQNRATGQADRSKVDAIATALGFKERRDFLRQQLNYWRPAQWLARTARPGERTLLVGEHRTMHFTVPVVASDWFDTPQPIPWIRQTKTNDEMLDLLLKEKVRYIFYNRALLGEGNQYEMYFHPRFSAEGWARFEALWKNPRLKQIYPAAEQEGIFIFAIEGKRSS